MITVSVKRTSGDWGAIESAITAGLEKAVTDTAEDIASRARAIVPVLTGRLRDSIEVEQPDPLSAVIAATEDYAGFVELGTSRMAPRPFLLPATNAARAGFYSRVRAAVKGALR